MIVLLKIWFVSSVLSIIASTAYSSVIPAAIIRRHTVTYKDVPAQSYKPIQHPVVYVPSSMVNLFVHFRSKSSQVHLKHIHKGNVGQIQHSVSSDEPHYLKHEIKKPVIQTIREVIVPYRQVIQEIKPVIEEVKTVVATRVPKSTVYMNFGPKYTNQDSYDNYRYVMNTNHESIPLYNSADNGVSDHNSVESPSDSSNENQNSWYDLSTIYGIKPTVDQLAGYLMSSQKSAHASDNQNNPGYSYSSPLVYGLTRDIQSDSGTSSGYGYNQNTVQENSAENDVQNSGYREVISSYQKDNTVDQNQSPLYSDNNDYRDKSYEQNYNLMDNIEPQYYLTEMETKNSGNPNGFYSDINSGYESHSQHDSNSRYITQNVVNSGYSDEYSGDLATSDGSALQNPSETAVSPIFGPFSSVPITKSTTLASLAQLVSSLPYQYNYENAMNMKMNT